MRAEAESVILDEAHKSIRGRVCIQAGIHWGPVFGGVVKSVPNEVSIQYSIHLGPIVHKNKKNRNDHFYHFNGLIDVIELFFHSRNIKGPQDRSPDPLSLKASTVFHFSSFVRHI